MARRDGIGSALAIARAVRSGELNAVALVQKVLDDIASRNARFNAVSMIFEARAFAAARRADERVRDGRDPGVLAGVPFLVKSNFDVAGYPTVAGSPTRLRTSAANADAAMVMRLVRAGAVPVGATHMDELACGATGENPHFGPVRLPADPDRMTGGSSSGSAAAVAAGFVPLALGSDTNGSIRAPAALCGVWGIKPGNGRLANDGCLPYAPSLDAVGGFAATLDDLDALYDVLCDAPLGARNARPEAAAASGKVKHVPLRVAVLTGGFERRADAHARRAVDWATACFAQHDAVHSEPINEDVLAKVRAAALTVSNFELARSHATLLDAEAALLSDRVRERIQRGLAIAESAYADALAQRAAWRAQMEALFERFDILIAPGTPCAAPRFSDTTVTLDGEVLEPGKVLGLFTQPISFAALPVVSAPYHASGELPAGVQVIGGPGGEKTCLTAARCLSFVDASK